MQPELFQPTAADAEELARVGAKSFYESHRTSAAAADIEEYIRNTYSPERIRNELSDAGNIFFVVRCNGVITGFAKIIPDFANRDIPVSPVCAMQRLYVLEEYIPYKIAQLLFDACEAKARELNQEGMWLNVWTGNPRAIRFYTRQGFTRAGETMFRITDRHSNPNFLLWKPFS